MKINAYHFEYTVPRDLLKSVQANSNMYTPY